MIHLLSPAKSLDFETPIKHNDYSIPANLSDAEKLVKKLKSTSKKKVKELMSISDALTELNVNRYHSWEGRQEPSEKSRQAIFAFTGDVYQGLEAKSLSNEDLVYAQENLFILSGMYGALKPLDLIEPYRLEMGTSLKVGRANNLYQFWKEKPTQMINNALKERNDKVVINLASNEYFKVIDQKRLDAELISPEFKDAKNGQYKMISFFAKKARGMMSRYIIENKINSPEDLQGFDTAGYRYNADLSKKGKPVFTREENQS